MKVSYNWLKEYIKNLPKPEKMVDLLTMHSFETKIIEKIKNDYLLDVDVLPNRAHDCLSHIGIARECGALLNSKIKIPKNKLVEEKNLKSSDFIEVDVQDKKDCPRYMARIIKDIKVGPSPKWLKDKLEILGQKPINNIVDVANYVMLETGQPLHVFDLEKIEGKKIIVRKAKRGEKITTLDNEFCELDDNILVIADSKDPLALAGTKGGKKAEISDKTKSIVLESANFSIQAIRKTVKKTNIVTEASIRFEHGLDPNLTKGAINRVAELIKEISSGKVAKGMVDNYPNKFLPRKLKINLEKIENFAGIKISKQDVIKHLKALDFSIDNSLKVTIPTFRQDINIEEDLIEEVIRLIGYNNIPVKHPLGLLGAVRQDTILSVSNKVKTIFEGLGFTEVYNFSFVGEDDLKKLKVNQKGYLELENPLSLDLKYLRKDLLINLLKNIKNNFKKSFGKGEEIKIFELEKVYREKNQSKTNSFGAEEEKMLAGLIVAQSEKINGEKFYELKGVIDTVFNKLGITDHWYDDFQATPEWSDKVFWQAEATAEIKIGDEEIGFLGEMNPKILSELNIKGAMVGFNLSFAKILKLAQDELIYQPLSSYPAAIRDLAILVNRGDKVIDVLNLINQIGGDLIRDVDLFDMYEGEEIPKNKKNLAFRITYQSNERTLKDEEIDRIQKRIIKEAEKKRGWQVRK